MDPKINKKSKIAAWVLRIFPVLLIVLIAVIVGITFSKMTVEDILSFTPENYFLAAIVILLIYSIKSLSVFFPLLILYISVGTIFPLPIALFINWLGLFICITIPYFMGRFLGKEWMDILLKKYKKAQNLNQLKSENEWFLSYFLRVINLLPGDIVSMFLGSIKVSYKKYAIGSIVGLTPTMLAVTVVGANITDPKSPLFLMSISATILLSITSIIIYRRVLKKK